MKPVSNLRRTVVIVQPYLPAYRVALFDQMAKSLAAVGVLLRVATGVPTKVQSERGDMVTGLPWQDQLKSHHFHPLGRWIRTHHSGVARAPASAVVVELAAGSVDTYLALLKRKRAPTAVWGHVGQIAPGVEFKAITWQCRAADHVFAYTTEGGDRAEALGVQREQITVIGNSAATASHKPGSVWTKNAFVYVGALDQTKRIDLLASLVTRWVELRKPYTLTVCGDGPLKSMLERPEFRNHVRMVGYTTGIEKEQALSSATAIICPGRVGLIAIDSLAYGIPIITTSSASHAPEFRYLTPGVSCITTNADPESLLAAVDEIALNDDLRLRLHQACISSPRPSVESASANFVSGIEKLLRRRQ